MGEVGDVLGRVRRDRQVANLLYGLLGWEDERDPQAAIESLAASARTVLAAGGPAYRQRVFAALRLLDGMILDTAEDAYPQWAGSPVEVAQRAIDGAAASFQNGFEAGREVSQ